MELPLRGAAQLRGGEGCLFGGRRRVFLWELPLRGAAWLMREGGRFFS